MNEVRQKRRIIRTWRPVLLGILAMDLMLTPAIIQAEYVTLWAMAESMDSGGSIVVMGSGQAQSSGVCPSPPPCYKPNPDVADGSSSGPYNPPCINCEDYFGEIVHDPQECAGPTLVETLGPKGLTTVAGPFLGIGCEQCCKNEQGGNVKYRIEGQVHATIGMQISTHNPVTGLWHGPGACPDPSVVETNRPRTTDMIADTTQHEQRHCDIWRQNIDSFNSSVIMPTTSPWYDSMQECMDALVPIQQAFNNIQEQWQEMQEHCPHFNDETLYAVRPCGHEVEISDTYCDLEPN